MNDQHPDPVVYYRAELRRLRDTMVRDRDESAIDFETIIGNAEHAIDVILSNGPAGDGTLFEQRKRASGQDAIVQEVVAQTSRHMGISVGAIIGPRRTKMVTHSRHIAMYLVKRYTLLTFTEIGAYFKRDHSSVVHAVNKITEMIFVNKDGVRDDTGTIADALDTKLGLAAA